MQRGMNSRALAAGLLIVAAAFVLWQFGFRSRSATSAFTERDLPPAMRADPNAPPPPITGPIPVRPHYTPDR
jgi:hypothetical protein